MAFRSIMISALSIASTIASADSDVIVGVDWSGVPEISSISQPGDVAIAVAKVPSSQSGALQWNEQLSGLRIGSGIDGVNEKRFNILSSKSTNVVSGAVLSKLHNKQDGPARVEAVFIIPKSLVGNGSNQYPGGGGGSLPPTVGPAAPPYPGGGGGNIPPTAGPNDPLWPGGGGGSVSLDPDLQKRSAGGLAPINGSESVTLGDFQQLNSKGVLDNNFVEVFRIVE
jgi:hypothetical protein